MLFTSFLDYFLVDCSCFCFCFGNIFVMVLNIIYYIVVIKCLSVASGFCFYYYPLESLDLCFNGQLLIKSW